ncbi:MAG: hypothetical protein N2Z73_01115 [Endomicrobia bacterium]|nr:hypothetical protein [Endomicrobiia bacterium]
MKKGKDKKINYNFIIAIIFLIAFFFHLRQQYVIIKLQKEINLMYDQLRIEENENKKLFIEKQKLTNVERLKNIAKNLNFVPIKQEEILIIE